MCEDVNANKSLYGNESETPSIRTGIAVTCVPHLGRLPSAPDRRPKEPAMVMDGYFPNRRGNNLWYWAGVWRSGEMHH
jgi:hypothetical protein